MKREACFIAPPLGKLEGVSLPPVFFSLALKAQIQARCNSMYVYDIDSEGGGEEMRPRLCIVRFWYHPADVSVQYMYETV